MKRWEPIGKCNQSLPKLITKRWISNKSKPSHETRRQPRALRQSGSRAPAQPGAQPAGLTLAFVLVHLCSLRLVTQYR